MQQILVYSDSLSWGIVPNTRKRLGFAERWPGVMEDHLIRAGRSVRVIEDCLNGRRTVWEDPFKPGRNGLTGLQQRIEVSSPLALVVLLLGTNDFQSTHSYNAWHSAQGVATLVRAIRTAPIEPGMPVPEILIVAPPPARTAKGAMAPKFERRGRQEQGARGGLGRRRDGARLSVLRRRAHRDDQRGRRRAPRRRSAPRVARTSSRRRSPCCSIEPPPRRAETADVSGLHRVRRDCRGRALVRLDVQLPRRRRSSAWRARGRTSTSRCASVTTSCRGSSRFARNIYTTIKPRSTACSRRAPRSSPRATRSTPPCSAPPRSTCAASSARCCRSRRGDRELAADKHFGILRRRLAEIGEQIGERRKLYNDAVNENNIAIEQFPGRWVAGIGAFRTFEPLDF